MGRGSAVGHQVAFFLRELAHDDPSRRSAAAKGLGSVGARQAWPELTAAARHDEDVSVRAAAIRSLGRLSVADDGTWVMLAGLSDSAPQVRATAARALRNTDARGDKVVAALTTALADKEWKVRAASAEQVGRNGVASPGVIDALVGALSVFEDWRTGIAWWEAQRALSTLAGDPSTAAVTIDGLRRGLRQAPADAARYGCLLLLGSWGPGEMRTLALDALSDPYGRTRRYAAGWLIEHAHPDNFEPLTAALVAERDVKIWWRMRQGLAALSPVLGTDEVMRLAAARHPGAVAAVARIQHPAVTAHARTLLGLASTRAAAAMHLGAFGTENDTDLLVPLLDAPDEVTRVEATGALAMLFHRYPTTAARERIRPKLIDLLTDPSWWVRHHAEQALDVEADADGVEPPRSG